MRITEERLAEGEKLKWWMGTAYFDPETVTTVFYPVPFHLVPRVWHAVKYALFLHVGKRDKLSEKLSVSYRKGLGDGIKQQTDKIEAALDALERGELDDFKP